MINRRPRVLIINDIYSVNDIIRDVLVKMDCEIEVVHSSEKALVKLDLLETDLILLHHSMLGIDAYVTCQNIKKTPAFADIPILFISELTESIHKVQAFGCGALDYLIQPIHNDELCAKINIHLQTVWHKKQLLALNKSLKNKVDEQTLELELKNEALSKADSQLKQLTQHFQEQKKAYELVIEGTRIGTFECFVKSNKVIRNQMAADIVGYSIEELERNNDLWISLIHPEDLDQGKLSCDLGKLMDQKSFDIQYRMKHRHGHWVWVRCRGKVTEQDENGNPNRISGVFMDITKEKQNETSLLESEKQFRLLSDSTIEGVLIHENGVVFVANKSFRKMIGVDEADQLIGRSLPMEFISEESLPLAKKNCMRKFTGAYEIKALLASGRVVDIELETQDINYLDRSMRLVLVRDISEKKLKERMLNAKLAILENFYLSSLDEILAKIIDETKKLSNSKIGYYHFVEGNEESISLQAQSGQYGNIFTEFMVDSNPNSVLPSGLLADCIRQREAQIQNDYSGIKNKKVWGDDPVLIQRELVVPIVKSGKVVAVLGVGNKPVHYNDQDVELTMHLADLTWDIVQRKMNDIERKKLSVAVEQSANSIVITNLDGNIEYTNQKFTELTGYTSHEAKGQNPRILSSGSQSKAFYADMWDTISQGKAWKGEFHNKKKNGELFWEQVLITPIKNEAGKILNYLAIKEDNTEKRNAEFELKKINERFHILEKILHSKSNTVSHLLDFALSEIAQYTQSDKGFVYRYNRSENLFILNNWSEEVKLSHRADSPGGVEVGTIDCLHLAVNAKRPIIVNDPEHQYPFVKDRGLAAQIFNHSLSIPIVIENEVVAVFWLSSQHRRYDEFEARQMALLLEATWILVEKHKA